MTKLLATAFSVMAIVAACSSTPKAGGPSGETPPPIVGTGGCRVDADCAVVETKCCDHCNGGKAEAFLKAEADAHKATGCEATVCTEMACGPALAMCEQGACKVTIGKL
ncbi:MAG: hypothetical protein ABI867_26440 [Kofleriaceae bacterium]